MAVVTVVTQIDAPARVAFDLARDVPFHERSMSRYGERAVGGTTHGLLDAGVVVTWRARHFGLWFELTAKITAFEPPTYFRDSMLRGPFRRLDHDHWFEERDDVTTMRDVFDYVLPLGAIGRIADRLVVRRHVRRLLDARGRAIKDAAERAS